MARRDHSRPWEIELELETAEGNHIRNSQCSEPVPANDTRGIEARYRSQYPGIMARTKNCTATYNCHGLVFGSRRTQIYDPVEIRKILNEDSYSKINGTDVLPGDIVIYVSDKGAIDHSGLVIEVPKDSLIVNPKVISKWGSWLEFVHWANDCPWAREPGTVIEYYRVER